MVFAWKFAFPIISFPLRNASLSSYALLFLLSIFLIGCGGGGDEESANSSALQPSGSSGTKNPRPADQEGLFLIAGQATNSGFSDGRGAAARFNTGWAGSFRTSRSLSMDSAGNLYVFDAGTFRRITPAGDVTTLAGAPNRYGTADGVGSAARFGERAGRFVVDDEGNIFTSEWNETHTLRKVSPDGTVRTMIELRHHWNRLDGFGIDRYGNLYVLDGVRILKITPDGNASTLVQFTHPYMGPAVTLGSLHVDPAGNVYFIEGEGPSRYGNYPGGPRRLHKITPEGVSTILYSYSFDFRFNSGPQLVHVDRQGHLYFHETQSTDSYDAPGSSLVRYHRFLRKLSPDGTWSTIDEFSYHYDSQNAGQLPLRTPNGVRVGPGWRPGIAVNDAGEIYYTGEGYIGKISVTGTASVLAGILPPSGDTDGPAGVARFQRTLGITQTSNSSLQVLTATGLRTINGEGDVTTSMGGVRFYSGKIASDKDGSLYAMDGYSLIKISPSGERSLMAGSASTRGDTDGWGTEARLPSARGLKVDADGNVYLFGETNLRRVTPSGQVTTIAGQLYPYEPILDGVGNQARFGGVGDMEIDRAGNLYTVDSIRDECAYAIRRITVEGVVTTLAKIDLTFPTALCETYPYLGALAIDAADNLYVLNTYNSLIHKVTQNGAVTQIAGDPIEGFTSRHFNGSLQTAYDIEVIAPHTLAITGGYGVIGLRSAAIGIPRQQ